MQITATDFRRGLFQALERAKAGEELVVSHKGSRFRVIPETPVSKLSRLTRKQVLNPDWTPADDVKAELEMWIEIEEDWKLL